MRYKMIVQYDGSCFHGFQRQLGYNSVQETLEKTLTEILKTEVVVKSAGRTDAGVHSLGQVIHFDSPQLVPEKNLKKITNKKVYPNIYIKDVEYVDESFHSRISAVKKEYRYFVSLNEYSPFKSKYVHFFHNRIDIDKIKEAMTYIVGTHDFKSFSKNHVIKNTIRTIELFELNVNDGILEFRIIGNGFILKAYVTELKVCNLLIRRLLVFNNFKTMSETAEIISRLEEIERLMEAGDG